VGETRGKTGKEERRERDLVCIFKFALE